MTRLQVEDGSMPAQTESCLGFKVRCDSPRKGIYKVAVIETNL